MNKFKLVSVILLSTCLFLLLSCKTPTNKTLTQNEGSEHPPAIAEIKTKTVSYKDATAGTLRPIDLEFEIPNDYEIKDIGDQKPGLGVLWGKQQDIEEILKSDSIKDADLQMGVFQIYWSTIIGFDVEKNKFIREDQIADELESNGILMERKLIGGYPLWIWDMTEDNVKRNACHIATLSHTNVVSVIYYLPAKASQQEFEKWDTFISSIRRSKPIASSVHGHDASESINNVLEKIDLNHTYETTIKSVHESGPEEAQERPRIERQIVFIEDRGVFIESTFSSVTSSTLIIDNNNVIYGPPWNRPAIEGYVKISDDSVQCGATDFDMSSPAFQEMILRTMENNNFALHWLLVGEPLYATTLTYKNILSGLLGLYDFKEHQQENTLYLEGVPRKDAFLVMLDNIGMPRVNRGVTIVDEFLKRYAKMEVEVDIDSMTVRNITVTGIFNHHPLKVNFSFSRKQNSAFSQN